jgi:hypothetical protein
MVQLVFKCVNKTEDERSGMTLTLISVPASCSGARLMDMLMPGSSQGGNVGVIQLSSRDSSPADRAKLESYKVGSSYLFQCMGPAPAPEVKAAEASPNESGSGNAKNAVSISVDDKAPEPKRSAEKCEASATS